MKTYINYIKESKEDIENLFLKLSYLDELRITFNFLDISYPDDAFYYSYYNIPLFDYSKNNNSFYINYDYIWWFFKKSGHNDFDIEINMKSLVIKYFKFINSDTEISSFAP